MHQRVYNRFQDNQHDQHNAWRVRLKCNKACAHYGQMQDDYTGIGTHEQIAAANVAVFPAMKIMPPG